MTALTHPLSRALAAAVERLARAGVDTPRLDAELLLAHVLGRDRTYLHAHPDDRLSPEQARALDDLLRRREQRVPLPYLLGRWEFMGWTWIVTPAVLVPRPETEVLVEAVAARLTRSARVLDVGAGSGCIAVSLARLCPEAEVVALEPSPDAAEVARANARALGVTDRVAVVVGRFPEAARELRELDAVISNPPYIPSAELDRLAPEVRDHEPRLALDGGPDGLALIRELVRETPRLLRRGGLLALEVMQGQAPAVGALLRAQGDWAATETVPDLAGIERVVLARRR